MTVDLISIAVIALVAALSPVLAQLIPGKPIPETVFLLIAGAVLGPFLIGVIQISDSVTLLSDLGLAFLFLLAGYEINPKNITGSQGKRGLATWIISLVLAFVVTRFIPQLQGNEIEGIAISIAMTTTALGTLMPILKERGLLNTRVGDSILAYGTYGELGPVIAMALLLSTRAEWKTILILVVFIAVSVLAGIFSSKAKKAGGKIFKFLTMNANTTAQTAMRFTVLLLVALVALSAIFDLDIVLGAFAAGFILRYIIPEGDRNLETKLDGVAYGFLIPIFFVISGAKINLAAVFANPALLIGFIIMLLLIRAVPILFALSTGKDTRDMSSSSRLTVSLYCTTALPIIVAVTSVAVQAGAMEQGTASVLVSAGAITVFLMPFLASITYRVADAQPISAVKEIAQSPREVRSILRDHIALERMLSKQDAVMKTAMYGKHYAEDLIARHFPKIINPMQTWVPRGHIDRASSVLNNATIDDMRWEEAKRLGDAEWEAAKQNGDEAWEQIKHEGDDHWEAVKNAGDEAVAKQIPEDAWLDQAADLQDRASVHALAEEARDQLAQRAAAARAANSEKVAKRFAEAQLRRIDDLQRTNKEKSTIKNPDKTKAPDDGSNTSS